MVAVLALLLAGLLFLVLGAEALVRGASRLATRLGIPPLVIGLTIVAYGTSSPEMAVSIQSSLAKQADIAIGNVVGSNVFNVLFILGLSALVAPLHVAQQLIRLEVPIMIGVSLLALLFSLDGVVQPSDGVVLLVGAIVYTAFQVYQARREKDPEVQAEYAQFGGTRQMSLVQWITHLGLIAVGLVLLVLGSGWLVESAVAIARSVGISELVIGLTIVAMGTSLPELATSVVASLRGERDIAVGNVVGSNIFNILAVLGISAAISPTGVRVSQALLNFDIPVMIAVAIACLPIFVTGNLISRWEGLLFLVYYVAYAAYLILDAVNHAKLPLFSNMFLLFVLPITVITLAIVLLRYFHKQRNLPE